MDAVASALQTDVDNYLHIFANTFLVYDYCLTLPSEIRHLWRYPPSISAWGYFFNRYFALFAAAYTSVLELHGSSQGSCATFNLSRQIFVCVTQIIVGVLMIIRVHALYCRNRRVLGILILAACTSVGVAAWSLMSQSDSVVDGASGCHLGLSTETAIHLAAAWESLLFFDTVVFLLMVYATWRQRQRVPLARHSMPLITLMLRDGAVYFAIMLLANLSNILTFYFAPPFLKGVLSTFASNLNVTMISRLMLNLYNVIHRGETTCREGGTGHESMLFTSGATPQTWIRSNEEIPMSDKQEAC